MTSPILLVGISNCHHCVILVVANQGLDACRLSIALQLYHIYPIMSVSETPFFRGANLQPSTFNVQHLLPSSPLIRSTLSRTTPRKGTGQ